jgi:hypothetical protein
MNHSKRSPDLPYRICKAFRVENAHMLSKHPEKCKFPHGHSRRVEVVLSAETLDAADMVCDFKAVKLAIGEFMTASIMRSASIPRMPPSPPCARSPGRA